MSEENQLCMIMKAFVCFKLLMILTSLFRIRDIRPNIHIVIPVVTYAIGWYRNQELR